MFIVNMESTSDKYDFNRIIGRTTLEGLKAFREFREYAYMYGLATEDDLAKVIVKSDGTFVAIIGNAKIYSV